MNASFAVGHMSAHGGQYTNQMTISSSSQTQGGFGDLLHSWVSQGPKLLTLCVAFSPTCWVYHWRPELVSWDFCNITTNLVASNNRNLCSRSLEARKSKSRCPQAGPNTFKSLVVAGLPWLVATSFQSLPPLLHLQLCLLFFCLSQISLCLSFLGTHVIGI